MFHPRRWRWAGQHSQGCSLALEGIPQVQNTWQPTKHHFIPLNPNHFTGAGRSWEIKGKLWGLGLGLSRAGSARGGWGHPRSCCWGGSRAGVTVILSSFLLWNPEYLGGSWLRESSTWMCSSICSQLLTLGGKMLHDSLSFCHYCSSKRGILSISPLMELANDVIITHLELLPAHHVPFGQVGLPNNESLAWTSEFSLDKLPQKPAHPPSKCRRSTKSKKWNAKVFLQQSWEESVTPGEEKAQPLTGTHLHQHCLGRLFLGLFLLVLRSVVMKNGGWLWKWTLVVLFFIFGPQFKRKIYWICILTPFYFLYEVLIWLYPAPKYSKTLSAGKSGGKKIISLVSVQHFPMVNICHCCVF